MICRHPTTGQKLDVAGLNEITVLIDRSETERTEVALNTWQPGRDGPPHKHERKEQNFLVLSGRGEVIIGGRTFSAGPGSFFFLPADVVHQTITQGAAPLQYFLFNAFLDADKEGHASFAEHINRVKHIRRQQADEQRADVAAAASPAALPPVHRRGFAAQVPNETAGTFVLLPGNATDRCEALLHAVPAAASHALGPDALKEQTLHVLSGSGLIGIGEESAAVGPGHTVFLPRHTAGLLTAGGEGLRVVSFGTFVR